MKERRQTAAIRRAGRDDVPALSDALAALAADIGDPYRADLDALERAGFDPAPIYRALLAEAEGATVGACLFWPVFSTLKGSPGLYVSDLWVAGSARGTGLGRRLLAAAAELGGTEWGARFIKLTVYDDNPAAAAMYSRLGFEGDGRETPLILSGAAFDALGDLR